MGRGMRKIQLGSLFIENKNIQTHSQHNRGECWSIGSLSKWEKLGNIPDILDDFFLRKRKRVGIYFESVKNNKNPFG